MENANTIPLEEVKSSMLAAVGYDAATKTLAIQFKTGKRGTVYQYPGVTPELYAELRAAPSIGAVVKQKILGKFDHIKIEPPKPEETKATEEAGNGVA